ncbi:MAG: hypothetical protein NZU63_13315 [Gemmataceae bacterium]|nr:hypothetical protein [Gemmataceae bacterium]MDW8244060.1 hypothetical protein [Thermogemmata sp.]
MVTTIVAIMLGSATPAQGSELKLSNVRFTIGEMGPPRKETRFLPGDIVYISYDIVGLTIDPDGTARYRMAMEISDTSGKVYFKENPRDQQDFVPLRGQVIPARAFVTVGLDQPPGQYLCKVTVTDAITKASASLTARFEVVKPAFGIVAVHPTHDPQRQIPAPSTAFVGQTLYINFSVVGFERDPKTRQPRVLNEYQFLDENGQPILAKPIGQLVDRDLDETVPIYTLQFALFLNRPGKFTARITATDKLANRTTTFDLPVTVLPLP